MQKYNISANLNRVVNHYYDRYTSAVLFKGSTAEWSRITVGVRQGCLLSPTVFSIFLERIITDALEDHEGTVMFRDKTITNFRFADDIDGFEGEEEDLTKLVECLDKPPQTTAWRSLL